MQKVLLLGNPTEHSLSPIFQQAAFDHVHLPWQYRTATVETSELPSVVALMRSGEIAGANVTIPHKTAIMPFLDELASSAKEIGAVNTIQIITGKRRTQLIGHNTDIDGVKSSITTQDVTMESSIASVIGNGGASLAVIAGLQSLGAKKIHLLGRNIVNVQEVIDRGWVTEIIPHDLTSIPTSELAGLLIESTVIVQATSVGMTGGSAPNQSPIPNAVLESALNKSTLQQLLFDLVYSPINTPFLNTIDNMNVVGINGLEMLLRQGAAAFEIWTTRTAPIEIMRASLKEAAI